MRHGDVTAPAAHNTPWLESGAVSPDQVYQSHFLPLPRISTSLSGGKKQDQLVVFVVGCSVLHTLPKYLWEGV